MEINNVIICGLGALGLTYANRLKNVCNLRILADSRRVKRYKKNIPNLNGKEVNLQYITPDEDFEADLIIISTKASGLDSAIEYIKNFVADGTIIISLINGISSEEIISGVYPKAKVLRSFFIGHSAVKNGISVTQDGIGKIVLEKDIVVERFFEKNSIDYEISDDILYFAWLKLGVNIVLNELSAIYKMTVGEIRALPEYLFMAKNLLSEVKQVADKVGVNNLENYEEKVLNAVKLIADDGKTSMLQDVLAKRKTEVEIFSGEIIRLGKKYGVKTSYNEEVYNKIKLIERDFS